MTFAGIGNIVHRDHSTIINAVNIYTDLINYDRITTNNYQKAFALLGNYLQERVDAEHLNLQDGTGIVEV